MVVFHFLVLLAIIVYTSYLLGLRPFFGKPLSRYLPLKKSISIGVEGLEFENPYQTRVNLFVFVKKEKTPYTFIVKLIHVAITNFLAILTIKKKKF